MVLPESSGHTTATDFEFHTSGSPFAALASVSPMRIVSTFLGHSTVHRHAAGSPASGSSPSSEASHGIGVPSAGLAARDGKSKPSWFG